MIGTLARLYAYTHWPRATFALRHPRTTARLAKARWDLRHAYAPRITAASAAIIALPLGYALGRMIAGGECRCEGDR